MLDRWRPWINECITFLDAKGTFKFFKYSGSYSEQPDIDIQIYNIIRTKWVELTNQKMHDEMAGIKGK